MCRTLTLALLKQFISVTLNFNQIESYSILAHSQYQIFITVMFS